MGQNLAGVPLFSPLEALEIFTTHPDKQGRSFPRHLKADVQTVASSGSNEIALFSDIDERGAFGHSSEASLIKVQVLKVTH